MWSAEKLKNIRLKAMMSQQSFAKVLGVSLSTVARWETGKFTPSFSVQKKLTDFCKGKNIDLN